MATVKGPRWGIAALELAHRNCCNHESAGPPRESGRVSSRSVSFGCWRGTAALVITPARAHENPELADRMLMHYDTPAALLGGAFGRLRGDRYLA